ncbi:hypothetical protein MnTg03_00251 [bacterium MnTg03]|nr:hypothetical protein MnTg03_00251 [bacterium MnTg03]
MHIETKIEAGRFHLFEHMIDLRTFLQARLMPFPVQIDTGRVGTQMTAPAAVWIHVWHQVDDRFLQYSPHYRVAIVDQPVNQPFHPPFGHGFARVLSRHHPQGLVCLAGISKAQAVDGLAIERTAQCLDLALGATLRKCYQIAMAFHRIGREISEVNLILLTGMLYHELLSIKRGIDAEPVFAIIGCHRPIILPPTGISRTRSIVDDISAGDMFDIPGAKIKPLVKIRLVIGSNA